MFYNIDSKCWRYFQPGESLNLAEKKSSSSSQSFLRHFFQFLTTIVFQISTEENQLSFCKFFIFKNGWLVVLRRNDIEHYGAQNKDVCHNEILRKILYCDTHSNIFVQLGSCCRNVILLNFIVVMPSVVLLSVIIVSIIS